MDIIPIPNLTAGEVEAFNNASPASQNTLLATKLQLIIDTINALISSSEA
jgi:hypothetical protein